MHNGVNQQCIASWLQKHQIDLPRLILKKYLCQMVFGNL